MRRRMAAVAAAGVLAVGAGCSDAGGHVAGPLASTTSTTARDTGTTATTEPTAGRPDPDGGGRGGSDGRGGQGGEDCGPTPVWAFAPMPRSASQEPDDCDDRPVEPELGTGDVQVTLRWSSSADLDLHVTEPDGTEIWYQNKGPTDTGGQLDVDSNIGCDRESSVENVFWPEGRMPRGEFTVEVVGYQVDGCGSGGYTLTADVDGQQVLDERGSVGENESDTYDFET